MCDSCSAQKQNDILYQKHYWFPLLTDFGKTLKATVNIQYKPTETVSLQSGKSLAFSANSSYFTSFFILRFCQKKHLQYGLIREKLKKCKEESAQAKFTDKGGKIFWSQNAFRIKMTQNRMQVAKFVSVLAAGPEDYQCPLEHGTFAGGMEFHLKAGEDQLHTKSMICSLLYTFSSHTAPISWGMVVPGHLPGSNGPSFQSSSPWTSLSELRQPLYPIRTNFVSLCPYHMA